MAVIIKYLRYLLIHKWYVFVECCKLGIPLMGIVHDLSKFSTSEFLQYARYFYGDKTDKDSFDRAWLHHQKANKHHWQYWILVYDNEQENIVCLDIPMKYRKELLADWTGVSKAANNGVNKLSEWYDANKHNIVLNPNTREWIERQLEQL